MRCRRRRRRRYPVRTPRGPRNSALSRVEQVLVLVRAYAPCRWRPSRLSSACHCRAPRTSQLKAVSVGKPSRHSLNGTSLYAAVAFLIAGSVTVVGAVSVAFAVAVVITTRVALTVVARVVARRIAILIASLGAAVAWFIATFVTLQSAACFLLRNFERHVGLDAPCTGVR